jgi:hypothetical protein
MSAKAQTNGIRPSAWTVTVESRRGKDVVMVGPYRNRAKAEADATKFGAMPDCEANVDPVYAPEDFTSHRSQL